MLRLFYSLSSNGETGRLILFCSFTRPMWLAGCDYLCVRRLAVSELFGNKTIRRATKCFLCRHSFTSRRELTVFHKWPRCTAATRDSASALYWKLSHVAPPCVHGYCRSVNLYLECLALCKACKASIDNHAFNCDKLWVSLQLFVISLQTLLNCFLLAVFSWVMMQWFHASNCNCTSRCTRQSPCQILHECTRECTWDSAEPTLTSHPWLQYLKCTCERVCCIWSLSTERKRVHSCYVHLPLLEISCVMRITTVLWVLPRMLV